MKLSIPAGTTSKRIAIFIQDSSSTTGAGLTGLAFGSSGLTCYSWIDTAGNAGGVSQALQTATLGTWTTRGFIEKDATNLPGFYEFGIPDALLAAGVKWAVLMFKGATNMAPLPLEIEVTAVSNQDAVRGGMTALPNANAEAAGGLYTRGTGAGQIAQDANGNVRVNVDTIKTNAVVNAGTITFPTTATLASTTNITAGTMTTTTNLTTNNDKTGYTLSAAGVQAVWDALTSALTTVGSVGKRIADFLTGDAFVRLGAPAGASVSADVAAVKSDTAAIKTATNTGVAPGAASGLAIVGSNMGSATSVTGAVGSVTGNVGGNVVGSVGSLTTNNDKTGYALTSGERTSVADALLDRDMSVGTDSGSPSVRTVRQALRFLRNKWSISAGTLTVTKENDATTSWTGAVTTTAGNPVSTIDPA